MGCPLQYIGFPRTRQQAPPHLNTCLPLSRLFLNGWRTARDDIQVKYSPCFAVPETQALSKEQASSHWYSKSPPTPPHLTDTALPRITVMDTPWLPWKNPVAMPSCISTEETATLAELYLKPMQIQVTLTEDWL